MKIEIEWDSSTEGIMRIEGRELKIFLRPGLISLDGLTRSEREDTVGGMIAEQLYPIIADAMQAEAVAYEETAADPSPSFAWKKLSPAIADAVWSRLS